MESPVHNQISLKYMLLNNISRRRQENRLLTISTVLPIDAQHRNKLPINAQHPEIRPITPDAWKCLNTNKNRSTMPDPPPPPYL